jgi:hypothetical protein
MLYKHGPISLLDGGGVGVDHQGKGCSVGWGRIVDCGITDYIMTPLLPLALQGQLTAT